MYTTVLIIEEDWYAYGAEYIFPIITPISRAAQNRVFTATEDQYHAYGNEYQSATMPDVVFIPIQVVWFDSTYYSYNNKLLLFIVAVIDSIISLKLNGNFVACEPVTKIKMNSVYSPIPRLKVKLSGEFK